MKLKSQIRKKMELGRYGLKGLCAINLVTAIGKSLDYVTPQNVVELNANVKSVN